MIFVATVNLEGAGLTLSADSLFTQAFLSQVDPVAVSEAILNSRQINDAGPFALCMGFMLMSAAVLYALWLYRHRDQHPLPRFTYHRIARLMGLSLSQELRLWWLGRSCGLPSPVTLMLCPATFDHHVNAYFSRFQAAPKPGRQRLAAIRQQLFPSDTPEIG